MTRLVYALCIASLFPLVACKGSGGGDSKCQQALDKSMALALEVAEKMAGMSGTSADEAKDKLKAELSKSMPQALEKCEASVKNDAEFSKALDCIIGAEDIKALQGCDSASLNNLMVAPQGSRR